MNKHISTKKNLIQCDIEDLSDIYEYYENNLQGKHLERSIPKELSKYSISKESYIKLLNDFYSMIRNKKWILNIFERFIIKSNLDKEILMQYGYNYLAVIFYISVEGYSADLFLYNKNFSKLELIFQEIKSDRLFIKNILQKYTDTEEYTLNENDQERISIIFSLPKWLLQMWLKQKGVCETLKLCKALLKAPSITARISPHLTTRTIAIETLKQIYSKQHISETNYSPFGISFSQKNEWRYCNLYNTGSLDIQDEGSQLISMALIPKNITECITKDATKKTLFVDLCAGSGGKSLLATSILLSLQSENNTFEWISVDKHSKRLKELEKRKHRSKVDIIQTRCADILDKNALTDLKNKADVVLVDAPCSGLGTLKKNPEIKWNITETAITEFPKIQLSILEKANYLLKKGGRLIYSTCTINYHENEEVVSAFCSLHKYEEVDIWPFYEEISTILLKNDIKKTHGVEIAPHIFNKIDGFFIAVLKKL